MTKVEPRLDVRWLGTVPYTDAWTMQTDLHDRRARDEAPDTLLLLEHPHVYTVGRRGTRADVLLDTDALASRGVDVVETDRGGQVTYHGPGQLVGYPIVHLGARADVVRYLRDLEEALLRTLSDLGIDGSRDPEQTGVWVSDAKIAAIGVRITRGVTKHGFAVNVSTDLSYFAGIVPCGILDRGVTSVEAVLGAAPSVEEVAGVFAARFDEVFVR